MPKLNSYQQQKLDADDAAFAEYQSAIREALEGQRDPIMWSLMKAAYRMGRLRGIAIGSMKKPRGRPRLHPAKQSD